MITHLCLQSQYGDDNSASTRRLHWVLEGDRQDTVPRQPVIHGAFQLYSQVGLSFFHIGRIRGNAP